MPIYPAQGYAGDVHPSEAWEILKSNDKAVLVDVRTTAEWTFVGEPELKSLGKTQVRLPWRHYPSYALNEEFVDQFAAEEIDKDAPVLLLCKVGGRSRDAALALSAAGWQSCFNIVEGFEGEPDAKGHRGTLGGWKAAGLPWGQK